MKLHGLSGFVKARSHSDLSSLELNCEKSKLIINILSLEENICASNHWFWRWSALPLHFLFLLHFEIRLLIPNWRFAGHCVIHSLSPLGNSTFYVIFKDCCEIMEPHDKKVFISAQNTFVQMVFHSLRILLFSFFSISLIYLFIYILLLFNVFISSLISPHKDK